MKNLIDKLFFNLLLLAEDKASIWVKLTVIAKLLLTFGPIAYLLGEINAWFTDNKQFVTFVIAAIIINMVIGVWRHKKLNTFKWETLLIKTARMMAILITTFVLLEMISITAGENFLSQSFRIIVHVATIFYPASKALKSIYIISNGDYPPKWIMEKVYSFEKGGNLTKFFEERSSEDEL